MDIHPTQCCYGGQADEHGLFATKRHKRRKNLTTENTEITKRRVCEFPFSMCSLSSFAAISSALQSAAPVCSVRSPREALRLLRGPPREAKPFTRPNPYHPPTASRVAAWCNFTRLYAVPRQFGRQKERLFTRSWRGLTMPCPTL
jgi:hypothetical protein